MSPTTTNATRSAQPRSTARAAQDSSSAPYNLPVVGTAVPSGLVEKGFWVALVGSAALGAVDPPLAALLGAGVLIARHRRN